MGRRRGGEAILRNILNISRSRSKEEKRKGGKPGSLWCPYGKRDEDVENLQKIIDEQEDEIEDLRDLVEKQRDAIEELRDKIEELALKADTIRNGF